MNESFLSQLYLKDTAFQSLMQQRIFNVLLVASAYDAFMLEEDGRVEEQIFLEYVSLNLSSPPRVTWVGTHEEADKAILATQFDLIIDMPGVDVSSTFEWAKGFKADHPDTPFVVLTPFSREVSLRLANEDFTGVDYVFSWLGNVDLLVAIIKLLEDKMNAPADVNGVGVQMILMVEDSVRFYSSMLPTLYNFILRQSQRLSTEALNAHEAMLRMRGRPKVMLARDYEEAMDIYRTYQDHILGVISDVSFKRHGRKDRQAGIALAHELRNADPFLPIIIESTDVDNKRRVNEFGGTFLDKNSKKLPVDLGDAIMDHFGFGDFIIRNPASGVEIMRIPDLKTLQYNIFKIPAESLLFHARHNDISRWLYSRALFPIAQVIKMHRFNSIDEAPAVRQLFFDLIVKYRRMKNRGVVAEFRKERFDRYSNFARIGLGSMGGKARGLAFIDAIIKRNPECDNVRGVPIRIPHTIVLCTDIFDEFMADNNLFPVALSSASDQHILDVFVRAHLPARLKADFEAIYEVMDGPLAMRSSSLLEDSHYQPFAGVYATYMVPHLPDREATVELMASAVKAVYASVFFAQSKAYMVATSNVIDQEKMAVIIQEVVGQQHDNLFYPSLAGVGRSINYYPVGDERPEDGVCELAIGLGKYIVDGGLSLRFSPRHPHKVLQTSTTELALRDTQRFFYALDTNHADEDFSLDEGFNMVRVKVQQAGQQGHLRYLVSTYDVDNDYMIDSDQGPGRKVATFANLLKHDVFPLAEAVNLMLKLGQRHMGRPVEIEFAAIVNPDAMAEGCDPGQLYWLQIRPMVDRSEMADEEVVNAPDQQVLLRSTNALGHGTMDDITTLVVVKPDAFGVRNNPAIAQHIAQINRDMVAKGRCYVLVGPGRWGSADEALGIPVRWTDISAARLIVELAQPGMRIEPSQGTHFFQNLTSIGVGYFAIDPAADDGALCDMDYIAQCTPTVDTPCLSIYEFDKPLPISINGQTGQGVVLKPDFSSL